MTISDLEYREPNIPPINNNEPRRQQILAAASMLFAEFGYGGTRMTDIAEKIGVTKPIVYRYFKSKEDLFADWLEVIFTEKYSPALNYIKDETKSPREITLAMINYALESLSVPYMLTPFKIAINEANMCPNITKLIGERVLSPLYEAIETMFNRAVKNGEIKKESEKVLSELFTAPIVSSVVMFITFGSDGVNLSEEELIYKKHYDTFWEYWGMGA